MRRIARSLMVAATLISTHAYALGLGEIRVNSALNEPLQAEIQLLQVRQLTANQIRPSLADIDDFNLAGLSKSRVLDGVEFDVQISPAGDGRVLISSNTPIREPFLSFLMEVSWPNGRLVREYTLLLDPPLFSESDVPMSAVQPASDISAAPTPNVDSNAVSERSSVNSTIRSEAVDPTEVYVDVNDTLYKIASNHLPSDTVSVNQMMLAIVRTNPDSFPTNNMNQLKAGSVIKLPELDEVKAMSPQEALREARRQYDAWKTGRSLAPVESLAPEPSVSSVSQTQAEDSVGEQQEQGQDLTGSETDAELKLVSIDESADSDNVQTAKANERASDTNNNVPPAVNDSGTPERILELETLNQALENRLLVTQENVAKVERDNVDLTAKLEAIAQQLETMQRLIELKDQQTAQLQAVLEKQMNKAESEGRDPLAVAIDVVRNHIEIAGAAAALFLLLLLLLLRKKRTPPAVKGDPEPRNTPLLSEQSISSPAGEAISPVVEPATELSQTDDMGQRSVSDSESIARAEAEIQSMIDEVLRTRAAQAIPKREASLQQPPEPTIDREPDHTPNDESSVAQAGVIDDANDGGMLEKNTSDPLENDTAEINAFDNEAAERLALSVAQTAPFDDQSVQPLSSDPQATQRHEDMDDLEARANAVMTGNSYSGEEDNDTFIDDALDAAIKSSGDDIDSVNNATTEPELDDVELDFVIQPFDTDEPETPHESQIPSIDMPDALASSTSTLISASDTPTALVDGFTVLADEEPLDDPSDRSLGDDPKSDLPRVDEIDQSDTLQLESDLDDILNSMESDIELIEEVNDVDDSPAFEGAHFSGADENETRLDLARAYLEMDDAQAARAILETIAQSGSEKQQAEAHTLLDKLDNT